MLLTLDEYVKLYTQSRSLFDWVKRVIAAHSTMAKNKNLRFITIYQFLVRKSVGLIRKFVCPFFREI